MKLTREQQAKVESILSQMTLEEKIGQMNQESPSIVGGFDVKFILLSVLPSSATNSSLTIFTTCCPGVSDFKTS